MHSRTGFGSVFGGITIDMKIPLVSAVVTSYNHAEYLAERMDSLLSQTHPNLEIIVVDDASPDRSLDVLSRYAPLSNVTIIALEQNGGYANASNHGAAKANGEFLVFAECDDYSSPDQMERLLHPMLEDPSVGVVFSRSHIVNSAGVVIGSDFDSRDAEFRRHCRHDTRIPQAVMQTYFLRACVIPNMSAAMIRTDIFRHVQGLSPSFKICADWDYWCRVSACCDFHYISTPLNHFRTHTTTARNLFGIQKHVEEYYRLLYPAMHRTSLGWWARLSLRIHVAELWAGFLTRSLREWVSCFPAVYRIARRHDRWCLPFLVMGCLWVVFGFPFRKIRKALRIGRAT